MVFLSFGLNAQLDSVKVVVNDNTTTKQFVYLNYGNLFRTVRLSCDTSEYIIESKGNRVTRQTWETDHFDHDVFQIYVYKSKTVKVELYAKSNPSKRKEFYYEVVSVEGPTIRLGKALPNEKCSRREKKMRVGTSNFNSRMISKLNFIIILMLTTFVTQAQLDDVKIHLNGNGEGDKTVYYSLRNGIIIVPTDGDTSTYTIWSKGNLVFPIVWEAGHPVKNRFKLYVNSKKTVKIKVNKAYEPSKAMVFHFNVMYLVDTKGVSR